MSRSPREVLERSQVIAVVGASRDPDKAGGSVPPGLQRRGFRIIPVNPYADELFGEKVYRTLLDIPKAEKVDLVDVFRPADDAPEIARQAAQIGARALWLQLDIRSDEARRIADAAGMTTSRTSARRWSAPCSGSRRSPRHNWSAARRSL